MALATPRVSETMLEYVQDGSPRMVALESPGWWAWLGAEDTRTFRFVNHHGTFTACREQKRGGQYWYAYRKVEGKLRKRYLGKTEQLSQVRLSETARALLNGSFNEREDEVDAAEAARVPANRVAKTHTATFSSATNSFVGIGSATLLTARLTIPPVRAGVVERPRLFEGLQSCLQRRLTVISAPAGFGKSTLLASWKQLGGGKQIPLTWVSLDEEDNDPVRFWVYIVAAIQKLQPGLAVEVLPFLQQSQASLFRAWLPLLVNQLTRLKYDVVLALDDYHLVTNPQIHEALAFLLDYLPPRLHLVLMSRTDPPLALGRLRLQGQLFELRAADLRFTRAEVIAFFQAIPAIELSAYELAILDSHTEGWVVGLQLAALALQGHEDPTHFIAEFAGSHRYVLDYLIEEVLQQQTTELQDFLVKTSILERMHAPLCNALTGRTDSEVVLDRLERANLFVLVLDEQHDWYRYHQLFREFLYRQLKRTRPVLVYELYTRAATWYEEQGLKVEAIQAWLKINEFDHVVTLIESYGPTLIMSGEVVLLQNLLNQLPEKLLERHPYVALHYSGCFVSLGRLEMAETALNNAERWHRALRQNVDRRSLEEIQRFEGDLWANRTVIAGFRGDVTETIALAQKALHMLPEDNYLSRGIIGIALGEAYSLKGDLESAIQIFQELGARQLMLAHTVINLAMQATLLTTRGNLQAAHKLLLQIQVSEQDVHVQFFPTSGMFLTALGELWYEWNDLSAARNYLLRGVKLVKQWGQPTMQILTLLDLARSSLAQPEHSRELIQEAELLHASKPASGQSFWIEAYCAQLRLRLGQKEEAYRWAETFPVIANRPRTYWDESAIIVQARIFQVQQCVYESQALLDDLLPDAVSHNHLSHILQIYILRALNLTALDEQGKACETLEQALSLAEPEGYIRTFVDEGPALALLLQQVLKQSKRRDYIQRLLAAFESTHEPESLVSLPQAEPPLSERELHALRLLADGKSNQQIAGEFVVALSTVKTHINNIYTKLGVHSRTQALARARELLLIP